MTRVDSVGTAKFPLQGVSLQARSPYVAWHDKSSTFRLDLLMAHLSLSLAVQEMQGMHVYLLGAIAVAAVGGLIYALVRRVMKSRASRTGSDGGAEQ
jgi:hypothetical protein